MLTGKDGDDINGFETFLFWQEKTFSLKAFPDSPVYKDTESFWTFLGVGWKWGEWYFKLSLF